MPRCGADEFPRLSREQRRDGLGILLFCCFAGNDDRAGVDVVGGQTRLVVGFVDELVQFIGINRRLVDVRGKQDWRFVKNFTINDHKAAGKRDALAPQRQAGKNQMGRG